MKAKLYSKIFILFLCSLFFASAIAAQEKPQAVKFDEYNDETGNIQVLADKADRFAKRLKDEPNTTKGFIAYFSGSSFLDRYEKRYDEIFRFLENFAVQNNDRIGKESGLQSGWRFRNHSKFARVEFWIVPKDAENPDIGAGREFLCECPEISVVGKSSIEDSTEAAMFTANASGGGVDEIEYNWKVSAGEIIEGQGTPVIRVAAKGAKEITATVEIDGVCEECPREASLTTKIQ